MTSKAHGRPGSATEYPGEQRKRLEEGREEGIGKLCCSWEGHKHTHIHTHTDTQKPKPSMFPAAGLLTCILPLRELDPRGWAMRLRAGWNSRGKEWLEHGVDCRNPCDQRGCVIQEVGKRHWIVASPIAEELVIII